MINIYKDLDKEAKVDSDQRLSDLGINEINSKRST